MKFPNNIDLNKNQLQNPVYHLLAGAPTSPTLGQFYYNTNDKNVYIYDGSVWQFFVNGAALLATRLDQFAAPIAPINLNGQRLTNAADPQAAQDLITKAYFDSWVQGVKWKDQVRMATTTTLTLSGLQTIDGISGAAGDRVAMMNNTAQAGIYVMASGGWTRSTDADIAAEIMGMTFFVTEGATFGNKQYHCNNTGSITLGTTAITFTQVGAAVSYVGGVGITISGSTIAIDTSVVARKATAQIGNGTNTSFTVSHTLNTLDVSVVLRKISTGELWIADATAANATSVVVTFGSYTPSSNEFQVTLIG